MSWDNIKCQQCGANLKYYSACSSGGRTLCARCFITENSVVTEDPKEPKVFVCNQCDKMFGISELCYSKEKEPLCTKCFGYGTPTKANDTQIGGDHYKKCKIQPIDYILANEMNYCEGNVIKYITRWREKGGVEDLKKAAQYIRFLIEEKENER